MTAPRASSPPTGQRAILACDIVAFSTRLGSVQRYLREELYARTRLALDTCDIPFDECYREDRGDGMFLIPPPTASVEALATRTIDRLGEEIRRQHDVARSGARLQLRVALHFGQVYSDQYGVLGDAVIRTFRLLDAPVFKERVRESGACLSVILSDRLFEDVIRSGLGCAAPDDYQRLRVRSKETRTHAWVRHLGAPPGRTVGPEITFEDVSAVTDRLLMASPLDTREGRDMLVAALPKDLRSRIERQPDAAMDAYCILRPCMEDIRSRFILVRALDALPLTRQAYADLERALSDLPWLPRLA